MKIIWIFGPSAVGKKTLMMQCLPIYNKWRKFFNISPKETLIPVVIATNYPDQEATIETREKIFKMIYENRELCNWVIHGQYVDKTIIPKIKPLYPEMFSDCIYLFISEEQHKIRTQARKWDISYKDNYAGKDHNLKFLRDNFKNVYIWND